MGSDCAQYNIWIIYMKRRKTDDNRCPSSMHSLFPFVSWFLQKVHIFFNVCSLLYAQIVNLIYFIYLLKWWIVFPLHQLLLLIYDGFLPIFDSILYGVCACVCVLCITYGQICSYLFIYLCVPSSRNMHKYIEHSNRWLVLPCCTTCCLLEVVKFPDWSNQQKGH